MGTPTASRLVAVGIGVLLGVAAALPVAISGAASVASAASAKSPSSVSSSSLKALEKRINSAKHLTYEATYKSVSGGQSEKVTIAQAPPKSNFTSPGGSVIDTGHKTYYCSTQTATTSCLSAGATNPFTGLEQLFSPTLAITAFSQAALGVSSKALGITSTSSSATIAGQPSTCITISVHGQGGKYCVTKRGLLSYSGATSSTYFELTSYRASPPGRLFALPAGATMVTLPGGVTP